MSCTCDVLADINTTYKMVTKLTDRQKRVVFAAGVSATLLALYGQRQQRGLSSHTPYTTEDSREAYKLAIRWLGYPIQGPLSYPEGYLPPAGQLVTRAYRIPR